MRWNKVILCAHIKKNRKVALHHLMLEACGFPLTYSAVLDLINGKVLSTYM